MTRLRGREMTRAWIENGLWQFHDGPSGPGHFQPV